MQALFYFLSKKKQVITRNADDRLVMKNQIECCSRARSKRRIDKMCDLDRYQSSQLEMNERSTEKQVYLAGDSLLLHSIHHLIRITKVFCFFYF